MNISSIFIKRPVMTSLLMVWLVLMSIFAYINLPVNALPRIEFPVIQVSAKLSGAGPETMAQAVSLPLEKQFSSISGLENLTSVNTLGTTRITLQFGLSSDLNAATQDVSAAISAAQSQLPTTMTTSPTFKKVNPSEQPIIILALSSDAVPTWQLNQYAQDYIVNRLSMLKDVAQVDVHGQQKFAVRVYAKPDLLKARGIGLDLIASNIAEANINGASGMLQGVDQVYQINPDSQLKNAKDFSEILINKQQNLRLKDLATVVDDVDNIYASAWFNGKKSVIIAVSRQPGSNAIDLADRVNSTIPKIKEQLPKSLTLDTIVDRTLSVRDSLTDVKVTGIITIFLVIFVIFLFLKNINITLIPALSLPISIVITFSVLYFLGFSLNNFTLMALTLATGFIIDDAIVVLENIMVYREKGLSSLEAAFKGSKEISFTVISMTLSLIAAFIPVLFMPGIIGRLLYEFAITIVVAILISGFVALSLIPMLSQYLQESYKQSKFFLVRWFQGFYLTLERLYHRSLKKIFNYQKYIIPFILLVLGINILFYILIPKGFLPNEDTGLIYGVSEVLPETSFEEIKRMEADLIAIIQKNTNIDSFNCSIGMSSSTASNEGRFFVTLKPIGSRKKIADVMAELRSDFSKVLNLKISMQAVQNLRIGGSMSKSQYQYTLQSTDFKLLSDFTPKMEEELSKTVGFLDVNSDLKLSSLSADIKIDRDKASRLGLSMQNITNAIGYAYTDQQVSTIYTESDTYSVILSLEKKDAQDLSDLDKLYIRNDQNKLIPLSAIATITRKNAPLSVNHLNRLAAATISFNLKPGVSLSQALDAVKTLETKLKMPSNISSIYQGSAAAFQDSKGGQILLILATIFTIYIILGILYESYRHPLTILTGLPSAGLGALIFLWIFGFDLDVIGIIGIILLIGIVKKNAIMMIDYALQKQKSDNLSPKDAILEACFRRFRPIMMTTFAAIVGALPIALWNGSGSELRQPLGICIIGGLLLSQWLTLYITPLFYVWLDNIKIRSYKN